MNLPLRLALRRQLLTPDPTSRQPQASAPTADPLTSHGDLARRIDESGIDSLSADELAAVAESARTSGASEVLVSTVLDEGEPEVARHRAFGRIGTELAQARGAGYWLAA